MGMSATRVFLISLFLMVGLLLPGIIWQPKGSLEAWGVEESDFPDNGSSEEKGAFLLNYAILAPSIYNTQPWSFNVSGNEILIFADESRWLKIVDRNKREMYISIGGALENLIVAADHFGYNSTVSYLAESDLSESNFLKSDLPESYHPVARVSLQPDAASSMDPRLFSAITSTNSSNRSLEASDGQIEQKAALRDVEAIMDLVDLMALNTDQDIGIILSDDPLTKKRFLNLTEEADRSLYSNITFKSELGHWLSRGAMGPTGVQAKVDQIKVAFMDSVPGQIKEDKETINSSLYLGFVTSEKNDLQSQLRAGRVYERIRLSATSAGLSLQPMNRALQAAETESEAKGLLNGSFVQQIFCLDDVGPANELTPRRPMEEVLI